MSSERGIFGDEAAPSWGGTDPEKPGDLSTSGQKPMATRPSDYVETGYVPVVPAADGGVMIGGGEPPGPALMLTKDNLICTEDEATGRPACEHFVEWVTEAEGVTKGFGDQPKQIRCYCTRLATASELMEIGEVAVFACSARRPIDVASRDLIRNFRRRQRELAAEYAQEHGEKDL
jgi:hypothetical protein